MLMTRFCLLHLLSHYKKLLMPVLNLLLITIWYSIIRKLCMHIKSKKFKNLQTPNFTHNGNVIDYVDHAKYPGVINSSNCTDDDDLNRQMRSLYGRRNALVRNFKHCSDLVKIQLFKSFCCNLYCCGVFITRLLIPKLKLLQTHVQF